VNARPATTPVAPLPSSASVREPRRILVIDDNEAIHDDFRKTLCATKRPGEASLEDDEAIMFGDVPTGTPGGMDFRIDAAHQGEVGLRMVERALAEGDPYLLAFVDMRMPPGWDGVQTIRRLWEVDANLQVVICTAYSDYSWEQIGQELGTTDRMLILKKPFDDVEACQLASALSEKWLVTRRAELKLAELEQLVDTRTAELRRDALRDRLTGLPNRQLLLDQLQQAIARRRQDAAHHFALLFIDFDRFKVVNDSLGHEVGDRLLESIAKRLCGATMASTSVTNPPGSSVRTPARLGGDEFVVLVDGIADEHDASRVAEQLLAELARPHEVNGHRIHSTASIGVTTSFVGYDAAEPMIRDADNAMYRAKAAGKNRYVVFDQRMHEEAIARLTLENDLRKAVAEGQFVLHYQPIMSIGKASVVGFEALIRWTHPDGRLVSPAEFIPLAEELGVIREIGFWTMRQACDQLADWRRRYPNVMQRLTMSVNLSRRQLADDDLPDRIAVIVAAANVPPEALILEITENSIMEDVDAAADMLHRIRSLGVELHMDDFGTGYSSLSCLHRFPISGLKIDRSFVHSVCDRRDYAAVVNAIVSLANNLGITLVAEGIETLDQLAMLHTLGSDMAQGYLFAKPLPAPEALAFALRSDHAIQSPAA
jgi:diguanylate cyclase (GGDEF)-like protein